MNQRAGQTVMITGAAGNLGRAVATAFRAQGAALALIDIDGDGLERAYPGDQPQHLKLTVDLGDDEALAGAVARIGDEMTGPHVLCAIAGGFHMGDSVHETGDATWRSMLALNAGTLLAAARAVVPGMIERDGGKIVAVGAAAARAGGAQMGAYVASKAAVIRLTETMALELRDHGINVNCVLPSIIDTPQNRADMPEADPARWVSPEALARVIVFLASAEADAVHGAALPVVGLS